MTSDQEWTWTFAPRAADQFDTLDPHVQDRIVSKLDEVVSSEWREPDEFLEPLIVFVASLSRHSATKDL